MLSQALASSGTILVDQFSEHAPVDRMLYCPWLCRLYTDSPIASNYYVACKLCSVELTDKCVQLEKRSPIATCITDREDVYLDVA